MQKKPQEGTESTNFITLLNFIADPAVIVDEKGLFLAVNNAFENTIGLSKKNLINTPFFKVENLPVESKTLLLENLKKRMRGTAAEPYEITFSDKNGEKRYSEVKAKKITYAGHPADLVLFHDVTRRKRNEKRLKEYSERMELLVNEKIREIKESEEKFRNLSEESPNMIFINKQGRVVYANKKCEDIMGYTKGEFYAPAFNFLTLIAPKSLKKLKECYKKHKAGQEVDPYEYTLVTKARKGISAVITTKLIKYEGESAILGIVTDITERKRAEKALKESEERARAIVANAPIGIATSGTDKHFLSANEAFCKILGYTEDELQKLTFKDITHREDLKESMAKMGELEAGISSSFTQEKRYFKKDGNVINGKIMVSAIRDHAGKPSLFIAELEDITESKKREFELKEERNKLEAVAKNIGAGLTIISKDYRILWANEILKQLGDVENKICYSTYNHLDEICSDCGVKKIFEDGATLDRHEYSFKDDKGDTQWIELIVTPIKDEEGNVTAALELSVFITEKKLLQNKLEQYSQKLEKLVEARTKQLKQAQAKLVKSERLAAIGELAAMVGHDLRNPLTGIKGAAYYLKTKYPEEIDHVGKVMLKTIDECIEHSNKIINDLLEYSRELKLELSETNPKALLIQTVSMLKIPKKVQVIYEAEDNPAVTVDVARMNRVFLNILQNAVDAMPDGGTLTLTSKTLQDTLQISVADTGIGMSKKTINKLWTPLFTTKAKGMGFGLSICKRIVEAHKGNISVESKIGKGSTFTVTIPLHPKPAEEADTLVFHEPALSGIGTSARINLNGSVRE
jgi:PAS domain S-box-containing protein